MGTKVIVAGLVVVGCIGAAAAGGYLALRSNAADLRPLASASSAQLAQAPAPESPTTAEPASNIPAASNGLTGQGKAQPQTSTQSSVAVRQTVASSGKAVDPGTRMSDPPSTEPEQIAPTSTSMNAAATASTDPATSAATAQPAPAATQASAPQSAGQPAPKSRYDEVTIASDSVIGVRLESTVSSETARVEDRVNARLSRDLLVDGRVAIPAGTRLEGVVTQVERGGKFKDRPRLGIAFQSMVLADSTRIAIQTETIYRDGESPSGQAKAKVGGSAAVGAILGAMLGGKKGAVLGSTAGAAGGAAAVAAGSRAETVLSSGTQLTARLTAPVTVLIERDHDR